MYSIFEERKLREEFWISDARFVPNSTKFRPNRISMGLFKTSFSRPRFCNQIWAQFAAFTNDYDHRQSSKLVTRIAYTLVIEIYWRYRRNEEINYEKERTLGFSVKTCSCTSFSALQPTPLSSTNWFSSGLSLSLMDILSTALSPALLESTSLLLAWIDRKKTLLMDIKKTRAQTEPGWY